MPSSVLIRGIERIARHARYRHIYSAAPPSSRKEWSRIGAIIRSPCLYAVEQTDAKADRPSQRQSSSRFLRSALPGPEHLPILIEGAFQLIGDGGDACEEYR